MAKNNPKDRKKSKGGKPLKKKELSGEVKLKESKGIPKVGNDETSKSRLVRFWEFLKRKKWWFILVVVIMAGFVYKTVNKQNGYETEAASVRDLTQILEISGEVDAKEKVDLHFAAASRLSWVGVKEGDTVKKWQAIAGVDTRTLKKQLQQDLNNFDKEFRDFDQTNEDYGPTSLELKRILEKAQYDLENEVLDVEIRDLAIRLSSLVSPIEGVVTRVDEPLAGVTVAVTDIFQIVNPETLYFSAEIDEEDISRLKEGQRSIIVLDAYPEDEIVTSISSIDFAASTSDSGGTVFMIELSLPETNGVFYRLGLNGDVTIMLGGKEGVLAVPLGAVQADDNDVSYVEVLENKKLVRKDVELGLETDDYVEIVSGVSEGELIVIGFKD